MLLLNLLFLGISLAVRSHLQAFLYTQRSYELFLLLSSPSQSCDSQLQALQRAGKQ